MSLRFDETSTFHQYGCHNQTCFYCGRLVVFPHLFWNGHGSDLVLHPPCFIELTTRLFRDLHELECKGVTLRATVLTEVMAGRGPDSHDNAGAWGP